MQIIKTRSELLKVLPKNLIVAELGVFRGEFSKEMLESITPKELHLIDIWEGMMGSADKDGKNFNMANLNDLYNGLQTLYKDNPVVKFHKGDSCAVLSQFPDNYFDVVYIDSVHTYQHVLRELEMSYKKVKDGGYILGHDYCQQTNGVILAVNEFCKKYGYQIEYLTEDGCPSFYIRNKKAQPTFHIAVFSMGDLDYKSPAKEVLADYFKTHNYPFSFIETIGNVNYKNAFPPWCKLLVHRLIEADFILCWDLDLLPVSNTYDIRAALDLTRINAVTDTSLLLGAGNPFPLFKYNTGLLGIPKSYQVFMEKIYADFAPGTRPSWEQYYVNDELANQKISVNELAPEWNYFYLQSNPLKIQPKNVHYTWEHVKNNRCVLIQKHKELYFAGKVQPNYFEYAYWNLCKEYTITSIERMKRLYNSVLEVNRAGLTGDFVECGVYKGGSVMLMAMAQATFNRQRVIHLYDTFNGMTPPEDIDRDFNNVPAFVNFASYACIYGLAKVKENLKQTNYPEDKLVYHVGDVLQTLLADLPEKISILRLDTDWYASTKDELEKLYPKLESGGILIVDDYGHWKGARKAVDEYFSQLGINPEFEQIDYTAVLHKKP